ncbi:MAG: type II toxin-antitoxin system VapC family toxin [Acidimicrobiia bacterium]
MAEALVLDASAMVDLLVGTDLAGPVEVRLHQSEVHAPGHFDAEVLSALGRLHRAGQLTARQVAGRVELVASSPIIRHPLAPLLTGAWRRRGNLRLVDALYVELASQLDTLIVTTDQGLASASRRAALIERDL